ncbi:hypothetical protein B9Z55_004042 [Caenorhabditis nigoni]|uniref:DUF281 domain-containing protein n=2 Tax=Caenorhabditis nigoni TaxID=1611254 RepID=A0A2G5UUQ4_9PELO|nr:hypothetical protein B9Z55_004042 [Caenorhabditis nigoni]
MKIKMLVFAILLGTSFSYVQGDMCCPYPISSSVTAETNITSWEFSCAEPISMTCLLKSSTYLKVGIAGINGKESIEILDMDKYNITKTLICGSPSSSEWHLEELPTEYERFTCVFETLEGK